VEPLGHWREANPHIKSDSKLEWKKPGRTGLQTWIGVVGGMQVASIRRQPAHIGTACTASLDGWIWDMNKVASNPFGAKESIPRSFESVPAAKRAIADAVKLHPTN